MGQVKKNPSEMAGSQTAGRERVPEGKGRSGQQPQLRWLGRGSEAVMQGNCFVEVRVTLARTTSQGGVAGS